jgi:hypothetical protein
LPLALVLEQPSADASKDVATAANSVGFNIWNWLSWSKNPAEGERRASAQTRASGHAQSEDACARFV